MQINLSEELNRIAEDIDSYAQTVYTIISFCKFMKISSPGDISINFRDAIHHYILLYEAFQEQNKLVFIQNQACIDEHLNRGIKDSLTHILYHLSGKIIFIMESRYGTVRRKEKLRHFLHIFRNKVLGIRLQNIYINRIINYIEEIQSIREQCTELVQYLKAENLSQLLFQKLEKK